MSFVNVNGINLYYREEGAGNPLLLIHGTGFNADVWDKVISLLAQNYRTIAYDRRGYQRSKGTLPPTANYGLQQGEDITALLLALNATPATLLGWSAGGIHALYATLKRPDLVKRLVLYEPPLYANRYLDLPSVSMFTRFNLFKALGNEQAAAKTFVRWVLAYRDGRNSYEHLSTDFRGKLAGDSATLIAEIAGGAGGDLNPDLLRAQIKVPVTLLVGDQSPETIQKMVKNVAGILKAPIVQLPNANHLAQMDQPAEFTQAVKALLA